MGGCSMHQGNLDSPPAFNHFSPDGRVHMVDISNKETTQRTATAVAVVAMNPSTKDKIRNRDMAKGDVLAVAELAGIMGSKQTAQLIPLCHPLSLTHVSVECDWVNDTIPDTECLSIVATVSTTGQTGVEMEALTACTTAALTVYDMCKAVDREMSIRDIRLLHKSGGKSGEFNADPSL